MLSLSWPMRQKQNWRYWKYTIRQRKTQLESIILHEAGRPALKSAERKYRSRAKAAPKTPA